MNRTMPNQKQRPKSGTKIQQKPMPKQDKKGGIKPTFEALAGGRQLNAAGRQNLPPRRSSLSVRRSLKQAGNPLAYRSNYPVK